MNRLITVFLFICGCALAASVEEASMNDLVDQKVEVLNSRLPPRSKIAFNVINPPHIELKGGYFTGLNTLYRTKDNIMKVFDNGTFYYDFNAGFRKFIADYDDAKINGQPVAGEIRAKKSSFRIVFTAKVNVQDNQCDVDLEFFGLDYLDKVSLTDREGNVKDITDVVVEHALPEINRELNKPDIRDPFMNGLESGFCNKIRQMFGLPASRIRRSPSYVEQLTSLIAEDLLPPVHKLR